MMRLGIDLDGVCFSFYKNAKDYIERKTGDKFTDNAEWHFYNRWGLSNSQFSRYMKAGVEEWEIFFNQDPLPNTVETLSRLKKDGHEIYIVTSRNDDSTGEGTCRNTVAWIRKWKIPYDGIFFTSKKHSVDADLFLDDDIKHYQSIWDAGKMCVLMDNQFNQSLTNALRALDWRNFYIMASNFKEFKDNGGFFYERRSQIN